MVSPIRSPPEGALRYTAAVAKARKRTWIDEGARASDYLIFHDPSKYGGDFPSGYYDVMRVTSDGGVTGELFTGRSESEALQGAKNVAKRQQVQCAAVFRVLHDDTLRQVGHAGIACG